jgi:hypothetical protein
VPAIPPFKIGCIIPTLFLDEGDAGNWSAKGRRKRVPSLLAAWPDGNRAFVRAEARTIDRGEVPATGASFDAGRCEATTRAAILLVAASLS